VIGGGTPMNLYSIRQYPDPDAAYIVAGTGNP
jgi:hypothetical protein